MYKKVWYTCKVVVLLFKPIALMTFSLSSLSSDLKVPIVFVTWCYHTPSSKKERVHSLFSYTAISRKVVERNAHATIPKGNMEYDQYTVCNDRSCRTYFCCFPLVRANICPWSPGHSFKFLWRTVPSKPPTITFGIVACTFSDNLSGNSCIYPL